MIANIVSTEKIDAPIHFNIVNKQSNIITGLPTLIVGYNIVSKQYPDMDITNNNIIDNIYWTFSKKENRDKFNYYLNFFIRNIYIDYVSKINYIFVDILHYNSKTLLKIIKKIYNLANKIAYINDNMLYIYSNHEMLIFGVSLKQLKFLDINVEKIIKKVTKYTKVISNDESTLFNICEKYLNNNKMYLPILYDIDK